MTLPIGALAPLGNAARQSEGSRITGIPGKVLGGIGHVAGLPVIKQGLQVLSIPGMIVDKGIAQPLVSIGREIYQGATGKGGSVSEALGLSGNESARIPDMLDLKNPWANLGAEFLYGLVTDPSTYVGVGFGKTLVKEAAEGGATAAVGAAAKAGRAAKSAEKVRGFVARAVSDGKGLKLTNREVASMLGEVGDAPGMAAALVRGKGRLASVAEKEALANGAEILDDAGNVVKAGSNRHLSNIGLTEPKLVVGLPFAKSGVTIKGSEKIASKIMAGQGRVREAYVNSLTYSGVLSSAAEKFGLQQNALRKAALGAMRSGDFTEMRQVYATGQLKDLVNGKALKDMRSDLVNDVAEAVNVGKAKATVGKVAKKVDSWGSETALDSQGRKFVRHAGRELRDRAGKRDGGASVVQSALGRLERDIAVTAEAGTLDKINDLVGTLLADLESTAPAMGGKLGNIMDDAFEVQRTTLTTMLSFFKRIDDTVEDATIAAALKREVVASAKNNAGGFGEAFRRYGSAADDLAKKPSAKNLARKGGRRIEMESAGQSGVLAATLEPVMDDLAKKLAGHRVLSGIVNSVGDASPEADRLRRLLVDAGMVKMDATAAALVNKRAVDNFVRTAQSEVTNFGEQAGEINVRDLAGKELNDYHAAVTARDELIGRSSATPLEPDAAPVRLPDMPDDAPVVETAGAPIEESVPASVVKTVRNRKTINAELRAATPERQAEIYAEEVGKIKYLDGPDLEEYQAKIAALEERSGKIDDAFNELIDDPASSFDDLVAAGDRVVDMSRELGQLVVDGLERGFDPEIEYAASLAAIADDLEQTYWSFAANAHGASAPGKGFTVPKRRYDEWVANQEQTAPMAASETAKGAKKAGRKTAKKQAESGTRGAIDSGGRLVKNIDELEKFYPEITKLRETIVELRRLASDPRVPGAAEAAAAHGFWNKPGHINFPSAVLKGDGTPLTLNDWKQVGTMPPSHKAALPRPTAAVEAEAAKAVADAEAAAAASLVMPPSAAADRAAAAGQLSLFDPPPVDVTPPAPAVAVAAPEPPRRLGPADVPEIIARNKAAVELDAANEKVRQAAARVTHAVTGRRSKMRAEKLGTEMRTALGPVTPENKVIHAKLDLVDQIMPQIDAQEQLISQLVRDGNPVADDELLKLSAMEEMRTRKLLEVGRALDAQSTDRVARLAGKKADAERAVIEAVAEDVGAAKWGQERLAAWNESRRTRGLTTEVGPTSGLPGDASDKYVRAWIQEANDVAVRFASNGWIDKDTFAAITRTISFKDDRISKLTNKFVELTRYWRGSALLSPAFSNKNFIGGFINNLSEGVTSKWYRYANEVSKKSVDELSPASQWLRLRFPDAFDAEHVTLDTLSVGQRGADVALTDPGLIRGMASLSDKLDKLTPMRRLLTGMSNGQRVEANLRSALFHKLVEVDGLGFETAWDKVKRIHFDYNDLSKAEISARRVMTFYTFMARNVGLQAELMSRNFSFVNRLGELRDKQEQVGPVGLQNQLLTVGGMSFNIGDIVPGLKVRSTFSNPHEFTSELVGGINPIIRAPIQAAAGQDLTTGRPYPAANVINDLFPSVTKIDQLAGGVLPGGTKDRYQIDNPVKRFVLVALGLTPRDYSQP